MPKPTCEQVLPRAELEVLIDRVAKVIGSEINLQIIERKTRSERLILTFADNRTLEFSHIRRAPGLARLAMRDELIKAIERIQKRTEQDHGPG